MDKKSIELKDLLIQIEILNKNEKKIKLIKFTGKISNDNGFELNKKFNDFFSDENFNIILDLSDLNYINSTGIAIIFSMFFKCGDYKGKLVIGGIHEFIRKVLAMMTLPDGFKIYNDLNSAIDNFN